LHPGDSAGAESSAFKVCRGESRCKASINTAREPVTGAIARATQPFRAFTVHLNDGRSYLIKHPDFISYSPNNREMTVHDEQGVHYIDMRNVSKVHVPRSPADASPNGG
jgi:hypothetical protein